MATTRRVSPALAALAALASGCPARETAPPGRSFGATTTTASVAPDARATAPPIEPPPIATGLLRRLAAGERAPLDGYRADAKEGDWVLSNAGSVAVVSAKTGRLLDFGARDGQDELISVEPLVSLAADAATKEKLDLEAIEPRSEHVLGARWRVVGSPLTLHLFYAFEGPVLRMESLVTTRADAVPSVMLGEAIAWGNVPTWVEGNGYPGVAGAFKGEYLGRDALGVAYALGTADGSTTVRFPPPAPGFHSWPSTADDVGAVPAGGQSRRRVAWLAYGRSIGDAALALPEVRRAGLGRWPLKLRHDYEAARCGEGGAAAGAPFAPFRFGEGMTEIVLPAERCFVVRFVARGYAPGPWTKPDELGRDLSRDRPRAGTLRWAVTEPGHGTIPARLVVRGIAPTPDPSWGDDPIGGAALNVVYADRNGAREIAPGRYTVTVSRGFEYTTREIPIVIEDGKTAAISAELDRVVDTRGWIAADLHVHAVPSPDAPSRLTDRVRSLAAAGVEVAVATDHNAITDYAPTIREMGLAAWLGSIVGDEITTKGTLYGHFNLFPLTLGTASIAYEDTTPRAIFTAARAAAPADRDKILQVNHPRMGDIGYFEILGFDPKDVAGWQKRTPLAEMGFDAIEVFNGDHYAEIDQVERCMKDWYALLDAGMRVTATGNSDSHKLAYHEAGVPWNYVRVADDDPAKLDERAFVAAVRAGRVVVSSGPFVRLTANKREIGDTVPAGDVELAVRIDAPPWVDVDRVDLVGRGGDVLKTWSVKAGTATTRLDVRAKMALKAGDWIIAIARGKKPMTLLHRPGATPFGFTNPIWVGAP